MWQSKINIISTALVLSLFIQLGGFLFYSEVLSAPVVGTNIPELSGDGKWVAFSSLETLTSGDTNNVADAFVYNRTTEETELISMANSGEQGNDLSIATSISANGQFVTFYSLATNFSTQDTDELYDVYVRDRFARTTELVSGGLDSAANSRVWNSKISGNGVVVAFVAEENSSQALYIYDRNTKQTEKVFLGQEVYSLGMSSSGQYISFTARSSSEPASVFVYNRSSGGITRASIGTGGQFGNQDAKFSDISDNGQFIVWSSAANNLVANDTNSKEDIFLRDLVNNTTTRLVTESDYPKISGDGSMVVFQSLFDFTAGSGYTENKMVYRLEVGEDRITRISNSPDGQALGIATEYPSISDNGIDVTYISNGDNLEFVGEAERRINSSQAEESYRIGPLEIKNISEEEVQKGLLANLILFLLLKPLELIPSLGSFNTYQLLYSRYIASVLSFLGLRKKRRVWGTVYDSATKQPLDPAVVELIDSTTGKVKETAITDLAGRFGFLPTTGQFTLRASKTHYAFPSVKESGTSDEIFDNLYHGELLTLKGVSDLVAPNIPMDPVGYDWNQEEKQRILPSRLRLQYFLSLVFNALFVLGFLLAAYNLATNFIISNGIIFALYFVFTVIRMIFKPKHLWGVITLKGKALAGAYLEITELQLGVVMGRALSSSDGKFFLKVPQPGKYNLTVKSSKEGEVLQKRLVEVGKDSVFNEDVKL